MTREEKESLLREAVDILIRLDNHLMTSRENAEFSAWVEDLMENNCCEEHDKQIIGHCKNCKYFEYDSVAKVDGIRLIVAHEICKRWGDGCKSKEDGYCFLFEPQESEDKE